MDAPPPRRRPREGSMEGTPINLGSRPPSDDRSGPSVAGPRSERPPLDRPPMMDRPPVSGRSDRRGPERGSERPPSNRPSPERPPVSSPPRRGQSAGEDDYVDFKPVDAPPDDEFDNSSNFDD